MSLYLVDFALLERIHDDLDRTRLVLLIDTSEKCASIVHYFNLTQVYGLLETSQLLTIQTSTLLEFSDRFIHACCEHNW